MKQSAYVLWLLPLLGSAQYAHSHPGRTDCNGGHWDRKDRTYHYHSPKSSSCEKTASRRSPSTSSRYMYFDRSMARGLDYKRDISESGILRSTCTAVAMVDSNTIRVILNGDRVDVRLDAVYCPTAGQPFFEEAMGFSSDLVRGRRVHLTVNGLGPGGAWIGVIKLPDGRILNDELIRNGYAWWYGKYSDDEELHELERRAREARIGLWAEEYPAPPWEHEANLANGASGWHKRVWLNISDAENTVKFGDKVDVLWSNAQGTVWKKIIGGPVAVEEVSRGRVKVVVTKEEADRIASAQRSGEITACCPK